MKTPAASASITTSVRASASTRGTSATRASRCRRRTRRLSVYTTTIVPQNARCEPEPGALADRHQRDQVRLSTAARRGSRAFRAPVPNANINGITLNLSGSVALGGIAGQSGNAGIAIPTGLIRLSSSFNGRGAPYTNYSLSFIDNLSVLRGNHSLKFGVEVRPLTIWNDQLGGTTFTFRECDRVPYNTPSSIAFNGDLSAHSPFTGLSGLAHLRQNYYILYAQDEFKIRPNMTLNYGLRWEYYSPLHDVRDKNVVFDMAQGNIVPKDDRDWYGSSTKNFGPRVSLSWAPERFQNKTVFPHRLRFLLRTRTDRGPVAALGERPHRPHHHVRPAAGLSVRCRPGLRHVRHQRSFAGLPAARLRAGLSTARAHPAIHGFGAAGASGQRDPHGGVRRQPGTQPVPAQHHQQDRRT